MTHKEYPIPGILSVNILKKPSKARGQDAGGVEVDRKFKKMY